MKGKFLRRSSIYYEINLTKFAKDIYLILPAKVEGRSNFEGKYFEKHLQGRGTGKVFWSLNEISLWLFHRNSDNFSGRKQSCWEWKHLENLNNMLIGEIFVSLFNESGVEWRHGFGENDV